MANRYVAGASGLPFAVLRGYSGTDLRSTHTASTIKPITCPFTGETLTAVSALDPTWRSSTPSGPTGRERPAVGHHRRAEGGRARAARSVVTVEEIVDELDPRPGAVVLPGWTVTSWPRRRDGAHPSYALGYSTVTTTTTWPGTPSPGTARPSPGGWTSVYAGRS